MMRNAILITLALSVCLQLSQAIDVRVIFYNQKDLEGNSRVYRESITTDCTSCRGFGGGQGNSFVSYVMTTPVGSGTSGNYTLTIYDGDRCNGQSAALTQTWGDFPDSLGNSVDSWKLCPPGKNA